jgi:hypothetical protein
MRIPSLSLAALSLTAILALSAGLTSSPALAVTPAAVASAPADLAKIVAEKSPSLVTVKFVLNLEFGGQSQELELEASGLMIDPAGVIVVSNSEMGGSRQFRGIGGATPKNIKILIGEDTEGLDAKVIGRDSELDLAWLRIEKPEGKTFSAITLSASPKLNIGDALVGVDRLGKYFDRAPLAHMTTVVAVTKKPRTLFIPANSPLMGMGVPMFTASGEFVGITVIQAEGMEDEDNMARERGRQTIYDRAFKIMPSGELMEATKRAIEAEKSGKPIGTEEAKPADEAKPDADKKPEGGAMEEKK